jgi:hypothetical protein
MAGGVNDSYWRKKLGGPGTHSQRFRSPEETRHEVRAGRGNQVLQKYTEHTLLGDPDSDSRTPGHLEFVGRRLEASVGNMREAPHQVDLEIKCASQAL